MMAEMTLDEAARSLKMAGMSGSQKQRGVPILPSESDDFASWSQLAELILEAEIRDDIASQIQNLQAIRAAEQTGNQGQILLPAPVDASMKSLAIKVATRVDDLKAIRDSIPEALWTQKKMERVVRLEQIRNRLGNYAELEFIAIQKLIQYVESGKIHEPGELIAVAHMSSKMSHMSHLRNESMTEKQNPSANSGTSIDIQINQVTGNQPNGDLPGPGSLGPIRLTLGHRVRSQLESSLPPRGTGEDSFLNGIEMLNAKEVQKELLAEADDVIQTIDLRAEK